MNHTLSRHARSLAFAAAAAVQPALAQEAAKELPTVSVQADVDKPDGYRATATRVGKVLQDPHDIPQAVTTLTGALLEEQQVGSLKEALRNAKSRSCVESRMARFVVRARSRSICIISTRRGKSKNAVISSRIISCGSCANARATITR